MLVALHDRATPRIVLPNRLIGSDLLVHYGT